MARSIGISADGLSKASWWSCDGSAPAFGVVAEGEMLDAVLTRGYAICSDRSWFGVARNAPP